MTNKKVQTKFSNKLLFCKLCSYVATSYEELDHHYKLSHESDDDISEEFQVIFLKKKDYEEYMKNEYLRICKGGGCIIRPQIDIENDKTEIKRLYKEYCSTCELKKYLLNDLKKSGKM